MSVELLAEFTAQQGARTVGWTETSYFNYQDLVTASQFIFANLGIFNRRLQCLGCGVINTGLQLKLLQEGVAIVGPQRRNTLDVAPVPPVYGTITGVPVALPVYNPQFASLAADYSQSVQQCYLSTDPTAAIQYHKTLWLSGMPDVSQNIFFQGQDQGNVIAALQNYLNSLTKTTALLRFVDRSGANPAFPCTGVDGTFLQYKVAGATFVPNQLIVATGFKSALGTPRPSGQYYVQSYDGTNLVLQRAKPATNLIKNGQFRAVRFQTAPIFVAEAVAITNKKRGRPFDLLRGRRQAVRTPRA
jgi:hypothetical protein